MDVQIVDKFTDAMPKTPPNYICGKKKNYAVSDFSKFKVTGMLRNSTRFRPIITTSYYHANSINLWRGSVFGFHIKENKWRLLKQVYNY
jgi:hypothetical protein